MSAEQPNRDPGQGQDAIELRVLRRVAEVLSRSFDLDVVLERVLELTLEAAGATAGALYLREDRRGQYQRAAMRNLDEIATPTLVLEPTDRLLGSSAAWRELPDSPDYPAARAAREAGFASALWAPLRIEEDLLGFFGAVFPPGAQVLPSTLLTVDAIAGHAAIAIRHARIHHLSERRARLAHILREFSERALAPLEDADLARLILDTAELLGRCDRGLVARIENEQARVIAAAGADADLLGSALPVTTPYLDAALAQRAPTIIEDTSTLDPNSVVGQMARAKETASGLLVTMRHGDAAMGYVFVGSGAPRRFEPEEVDAMQLLSAMGGELLERARRGHEAEAERRRRDAIVENLPMAVAVIRADGSVDLMNAAGRAFVREFNTMPHGDWREGYQRVAASMPDGSPLPPEAHTVIERAFRGEHPETMELLISTNNGERRMYVMLAVAPIFGPSGKVEAVVTGIQDVTALRELADARDRFLRIASHELRSPLTALSATASLFELDPKAVTDPERRELLLDRIQRQVARLTRRIEQLIDSARVSAQEPPLEMCDCDLVVLCGDAIAASRSPTGPSIVLDSSGPVHGRWDPDRLEQVLTNLLSNAACYSPADSTITVRVRSSDQTATVEVVDQGIGIPPEQIERLFTPFFRASNAAALHKGGLGLGLHIANEIVRRHRGALRVRSTVGAGSTFVVELPRG